MHRCHLNLFGILGSVHHPAQSVMVAERSSKAQSLGVSQSRPLRYRNNQFLPNICGEGILLWSVSNNRFATAKWCFSVQLALLNFG